MNGRCATFTILITFDILGGFTANRKELLSQMQRQQLQFLYTWLRNKKRKPLIIRGAKVGKSTLVELFARQPLRCNLGA